MPDFFAIGIISSPNHNMLKLIYNLLRALAQGNSEKAAINMNKVEAVKALIDAIDKEIAAAKKKIDAIDANFEQGTVTLEVAKTKKEPIEAEIRKQLTDALEAIFKISNSNVQVKGKPNIDFDVGEIYGTIIVSFVGKNLK